MILESSRASRRRNDRDPRWAARRGAYEFDPRDLAERIRGVRTKYELFHVAISPRGEINARCGRDIKRGT